jgi:hypothetical protein
MGFFSYRGEGISLLGKETVHQQPWGFHNQTSGFSIAMVS